MSVSQLLAAYALVGVVAGVLAARYCVREGDEPGPAGAVGAFVACFWPVVAVVVLFGWAAQVGNRSRH